MNDKQKIREFLVEQIARCDKLITGYDEGNAFKWYAEKLAFQKMQRFLRTLEKK